MNTLIFVYISMFVPFVAMVGTRVLFSLYALELGASAFQVGMLNASTHLFSLLLSVAAGVSQDRFGARWLLALSAAAGGAGILLPYFHHSLGALYAASALCGIWSVFNIVLTQTLVGMLSKPSELARNFSHYTIIAWATQIFGALIAGYSIDAIGHARACLVFAPLALLAITLLVFWGGGLPGGARRAGPSLNPRALFTNRAVLRVLVASAGVQLAMEIFPFFLPLFGHALGLSASTIGWLMAIAACSGMALCVLLPRLAVRFSEERLLTWSFAVSAMAFAMMPWLQTPPYLAVGCVLFGVGMGAGQPLSAMLMFKTASSGQAGTAMGWRMMTNSATRVVGPPLLGLAASGVGLASAPLLTAALLLGSAYQLVRPGSATRG